MDKKTSMTQPITTTSMFLANVAFSIFCGIPWVSAFFFLQYLGLSLYTINDKDTCKRIQSRMALSSHRTEEDRGHGYFLGRWYAGHVSNTDGFYTLWLISTKASYDHLTREVNAPPQITGKTFRPEVVCETTIYERNGSFANPWFKKRVFSTKQTPKPHQKAIIDAVIEHQKEHDKTVVLLHGPPGSGKSMIGVFLATQLKGNYCNTLKPWQPGDTLSTLYSDIEPSKTNPLILVFEEIDGVLLQIHGGIPGHNKIPIAVQDKSGWNRLLDEIGRGIYPNLILVLTSNRDPEFIDSLDPSYLREGRVDKKFMVTKIDDATPQETIYEPL